MECAPTGVGTRAILESPLRVKNQYNQIEICLLANFYRNVSRKRNISLSRSENFTHAQREFHISPSAKYFTAKRT
jgi:hypothetical protein